MLLDEPFGGLDAITRLKMQEYLLEILKIKGSVLFITHDIDEPSSYPTEFISSTDHQPILLKKLLCRLSMPVPRK